VGIEWGRKLSGDKKDVEEGGEEENCTAFAEAAIVAPEPGCVIAWSTLRDNLAAARLSTSRHHVHLRRHKFRA
jgi:hypothetical protein